MVYLSTLLISLFITIVLVPLCKTLAFRLNILDVPDERKVHTIPTPRTGGIAMALGSLAPILIWTRLDELSGSILIGAWILVFFGLLDDRVNLNYKYKFASQIAAALLVIFVGGIKIKSLGMLLPNDLILPDVISIPLTLVVIVGVTNAINLADGLDGLAGGITMLTFISIGLLAYICDYDSIVLIAMAVTGALFGFLRFNTYPALVFMGDAGSQFLGFLAITLALHLTQSNIPLSPTLPLLMLGFPILDTFTVMFQRVADGKSPFYPDKNHFHHKLMRLGLSHSESVLIIYILQALLAGSAIYFRYYPDWFLILLYVSFSFLVIIGFLYADKTGWRFRREIKLKDTYTGKSFFIIDRRTVIKICFRTIEFAIPALLLATSILASDFTPYFSLVAVSMAAFILFAYFSNRANWLRGTIRLSLYLIIPFIVYISEARLMVMNNQVAVWSYNLSFVLLIILVLITLRFSRREGFKSTPMDFLILFIAIIVPIIGGNESIRSSHMGLLAAKIIVFFFSYEVLIGELRGRLKSVGLSTLAVLAVIGVKGLASGVF